MITALTTFDRVLGELNLWVVRQQNFLVTPGRSTEWYRNTPARADVRLR